MSFSDNEMEEIINDFIAESSESLEMLDQKFIELEKNPEDTSLLNDIFRSVHTIKGAAGFLGFNQMVDVAHVAEDVLNKLRKSEMKANPLIMDALLQAIDLIKVLLNNIVEKNNRTEDIQPAISILRAILDGGGAPPPAPPLDENKADQAASVVEAPAAVLPVQAAEKELSKPLQAQEPPSAPKASQDAKQAQPQAQQKAEEPAHREKGEHSIRVDIDRLDSVLNLAGELVLTRNRMIRLGSRLAEMASENELVSHMEEAIAQMDLVTSDLQLAVMKIRMQPIAKVFNKFPRMVRDLARANRKEIELVLKGEETELDKTVIEEIGDPLVHLIRNAVDHGMETPEERVAKGKPACGKLTLCAYQEGRNIVVSVSDDGKGIDPAVIKRSAVEKGLLSREDADKLNEKDALNLIFIPGFSTAKQVSDISGRGVGMDVVKTNITKINGNISIESRVGQGTSIIFRLPLTLAIIPALTVEANKEIYGIPLSTVIENIRVSNDDIKTVEGREVIHIRDRVFPVVRLSKLVSGKNGAGSDITEWKYIVILGIGEKKFGLLVDRLHGQEEIVMKSMGEYLKGTTGIAGACITGDGNVILVLDIGGLLDTGIAN